MLRLVQLQHAAHGRRVAIVEEDSLLLLRRFPSLYASAWEALERGADWTALLLSDRSEQILSYTEIYDGLSAWKLLPAFDHPDEPARCMVSGTGLTHRKGAENRQAMHQAKQDGPPVLTDSMRIYEWGKEGGKPPSGQIGAQPEWFYKGCGTILRGHGDPLEVPAYADDGGEEAEMVGIYLVAPDGQPRRLGFALGNEFSDHQMEKKNYLYLAPSKLRPCAVGPELLAGASFEQARGTVHIERNGQTVWEHSLETGEAAMVHSLENLEYHHFKYAAHRRPGDVHLHFFGTGAFSFGAGVALEEGDIMVITMEDCGKPLRNPIHIIGDAPSLVTVQPL